VNSALETEALLVPRTLHAFQPSAARIQFLDQRMRLRLSDSLRHVFEQSDGHFPFSQKRAQAFLQRLEAAPVAPLAFSIYTDLVVAIDGDDLDQAAKIVEELFSLAEISETTEIVELADPETNANADRYVRAVNTDPNHLFAVASPLPAQAKNCRVLIGQALALLDAGAPDLAEETRALLRQIILAVGADPEAAMTFDGASSSMLWGAIMINADRGENVIDMAQMLVHESAHNLIFGLSVDDPLLENDPEERYASPLRPDPRPLEGIYHATYVIARMHLALRLLLESGLLSAPDQVKARTDLKHNERIFAEGFSTLQQHARLTPLGAELIEKANAYMATPRRD
jgi:hypothetical protein